MARTSMSVRGLIALPAAVLMGFGSQVAHATFVSSNPSWIGPDRGLSQVGTMPTFQVPPSPSGPGGQVTISNFNLIMTNPTYVDLPAPGDPPVTTDIHFTSDVLITIERNGITEYWGIDGQRIIGTTHFIDDWQGDTYRRVKAEMYCEDIRFRKYGQGWVFGTVTASMWRISPTRVSEGFVTSELIGTDQYRIGSFFDVFVEVSLDDGFSWHAAPSPMRWQVVPAPTSLVVLGLGGLLAVRRRR